MSRERVIEAYERFYNATLAGFFDVARIPAEARAEGTRVYDEEGNRYLDFAAGFGVFHLGHSHPKVQAAVLRQLESMASAPAGIYSEPMARLGPALAALLPGDLNRVFLYGSGSEAIEAALRLCLLARPKRTRLVAATNGYHGKTVGAMGVLGQAHLREPFEPLWGDTRFVPYGDAKAMAEAVGEGAAAVLLEPVLGGGFITVPPKGYLAQVREICDRTGTLLVADEVQTGFGRTGKLFAIEHDGIVPDVIILSKGITGGHTAMAAAVARDALVAELGPAYAEDPFAFGTDSGGWPIACAAACAALEVIVEEKLVERAAELGPYLLDGLRRAAERYPALALEAVGQGLMTGLRLRNGMMENALWLQMVKRHVVVGLSTNTVARRPVMRFFPPLIITREEIDECLAALEDSLRELSRYPGWVYDLATRAAVFQFKLPRPLLKAFLGPFR